MNRLNVVDMMMVVRDLNLTQHRAFIFLQHWFLVSLSKQKQQKIKKGCFIYLCYCCATSLVTSFCIHILFTFDFFFLLTIQGVAQQQALSDCLYCLSTILHQFCNRHEYIRLHSYLQKLKINIQRKKSMSLQTM